MESLRRITIMAEMHGRDLTRRHAALGLLVALPLSFYLASMSIGTKSITWEFAFTRGETPVAVGKMTSVYCLNRGGKMDSEEIPPELRAKMVAAGRVA